jgi:hypothetical protein
MPAILPATEEATMAIMVRFRFGRWRVYLSIRF